MLSFSVDPSKDKAAAGGAYPSEPAMSSLPHDEDRFPHAPDVHERETADGGFSAGWGLHHVPAETYLIDCHTHMSATTPPKINKALKEYYARAGAMRLRRHVALDGKPKTAEAFAKVSAKDDRFLWLNWQPYNQPDVKFLKKCSKMKGFAGLKLHNARMIIDGDKPGAWRTPKWNDVFKCCGDLGKPVLWHVTQRLTDAPYTGGGRNSYWAKGWEKGVKYGNRELMDVFLETVARHRGTNFIGAHHLHIGPNYLGALFEEHPNLYADFSVGNTVRPGCAMYEADREAWRSYTIRHQDRLLFGTDVDLGDVCGIWYLWETLAGHLRFLHQMRLPKAALEKVAHENFERLAGLAPVPLNGADWGNVRP